MSILLGVGVTTYNRRASLENTVEKIRRHTRSPHLLAVADDGSTDGSVEYLAAQHIVTVSGINRGIAWNKNRLLYLFNNIAKCDVMILIEDDTYPVEDGWEEPWVRAALLHGHINLAGDWFRSHCMSGAGTPEDPLLCPHTSGQCAGFSRESINVVGFMDSRYRHYGYEHAEHSIRMIKAGFGGHFHPDTPNRPSHFLLASPLKVSANESYQNAESLKINLALFNQIRDESIHRWAWRGDREMADFLAEMQPGAAMLERTPEPNTQQPTATEAGEPLMDPTCIYPILNRPHLFGNEIELMQRTFEKAGPNYLEFGTGGSTLMAVQRGNTVVSVESDPVWAAGVRAHREIAEAIAGGRVTILHADVGPVGEFGHPRGRNHIDHWNSYLYLPWNEWSKRGAAPDLVYVDGRFRVACCMSVIMALEQKFASGTMPLILMHDVTDDRPFYKPVFDFFETVEAVESLYLMRVRPDVSRITALAAMLRHQNDAR